MELVAEPVKVLFDDGLATIQENFGETIRTRCSIRRHFHNDPINLIMREWEGKLIKTLIFLNDTGQVKFHVVWFGGAHSFFEGFKYD